jgi:hypothetical protein
MSKRRLQIDVLGPTGDNSGIVECRLYVGGRCCQFFMSESNYEALMYDGVFIRDGKEKDSAGVINTTRLFNEVINPEDL